MSFYGGMQSRAQTLLNRFGQTVTVTHRTSGAYNPATGGATITTATSTVKGVVENYNLRQIDGTLIRQGDRRLLLGGGSSVGSLAIGDTATLADGTVTTIESFEAVNPGGTPVLYICNIRA